MYSFLESPTLRHGPDLLTFVSAKNGRPSPSIGQRLNAYFVHGTDDGAFLRHTAVVAQADDGLTPERLRSADYLRTTSLVPIFSAAFVEALAADLAADLDFHPCVVRCAGVGLETFFVARTKTLLPLVDAARSAYRPLTDGSPMLVRPTFHEGLADRFLIARDEEHRHLLICTPRFEALVRSHDLAVDFTPAE